ncbi:MAG: isoprenylcysteine carboxylmethyltransferase family protein [Candidatus Heimdallarchaeota archaeon]|nr:MAG: isoprenylcysteine carboxylmethyltransferase family protein [Candidatus Heimdallarchaeota archaeon]
MEGRHGIGDEHPYSHIIMIFCGILFASIWGLDSFIFHFGVEFTNNIHVIIRVVLFVLASGLSIKLGMSSHDVIFDHQEESSCLITDGVFSHVRHPMYLSILLLKLGFLLLTMSLISIIPWVICIILYDKIASFEERELIKILGEEYVEYMKEVPRWIPKFLTLNKPR